MLRHLHDTPTFKTEALHVVSNVEWIKRYALLNKWLIFPSLRGLWQECPISNIEGRCLMYLESRNRKEV